MSLIKLYQEKFSDGWYHSGDYGYIDGQGHLIVIDRMDDLRLLKGGKSSLGALASASHTASLAGNYDLINGVLRQAGIHQADDFFEMVDTCPDP
jgi:acyl-CoA synthetase (AMP-forming)/AMP-acid ligase II